MSLGRGTLLAKFDVESAYRIIPIHPNDRYLLGMQWQGHYFVDMALPFGLRSAPYIFSSVVDLVEWVLKKQYDVSFLLHCLDDFHTLGPPNSQTCQWNLDTCIQQFQDWGISLHPDKGGGPFHCPGRSRHRTLSYCRRPSRKRNLIVSTHSWSPGHLNAIAHGRSWSL